MPIKYIISFSSFGLNGNKTFSKEMEFNDEKHFENYLAKCGKDESRRKIIGTQRIYSEERLFTMNDLRDAYKYAKSTHWDTFEVWFEDHFKRKP